MKFILVIDQIAHGGAEKILLDYYQYLIKGNNKVIIFTLNGTNTDNEWTKNLRIIYGAKKNRNNILLKIIQLIKLYFKLRRIINKEKPDVIFSFLEKSNILSILIPCKAVKISTVHNVLSLQYTKIRSNIIKKILYTIIHRCYNKCSKIIAVSKQVKEDLIISFAIKEQNIHVINNYINKEEIQRMSILPIDNFKFKPKVRYIINIGRFSDQKAQWKLIKAYSTYLKRYKTKQVGLILMGTGEYLEELKNLAKDLDIEEEVHILPFDANPYKYMACAHLFVLSSIYEGFPIVLAEASALRIPFVGTDRAIPEEMFSDFTFRERCIFRSSTKVKDFSIQIHEDEYLLANLLKKGIEDNNFREGILQSTQKWEDKNNKIEQFKQYDALIN